MRVGYVWLIIVLPRKENRWKVQIQVIEYGVSEKVITI